MKNLEQLRSKHALVASDQGFHGRNDGDIIKKIPTMIQQNGFLGALAFAIEDETRVQKQKSNNVSGYAQAFKAILEHLRSPKVAICPASLYELRPFADWLCHDERDASELRVVTAEAMAYMNVLRRYAR